ncbi:uracil-DNA glycosylase [Polynucleobacter paludilacus]|uniref:uracil-DNA glycosylase n=1 Tax=Polynucleobacter paludilacus TaxID=1855895 RepID=UPI001BFE3081|nr:uracil-DNA glycosylase [Polynucleobacter paludilacus]QWD87141.1 uracil-DNA glycosylase [Polynucleobacter paludilacus]
MLISPEDIPKDWRALLGDYFSSPEWFDLQARLQSELEAHPELIRPEAKNFFNALRLTPVDQVKVIILGQDPYHSPGLAQGLAFSIPADIPTNSREFPSSLRNIRKALILEGFGDLPHGDLHHWASQGVLLLNTALSVRLGEAGSHTNLGWSSLINALIHSLAIQRAGLVWMLWGGHAQSKLSLIEPSRDQLVLCASHPSGLGVYKTDRPFLKLGGQESCGHFTKANQWLDSHQQSSIVWVKADQKPTGTQGGLFE